MTKLKTKDEFQVGKLDIGWIESNFLSRVPTEFEPRSLGTFQKLPRSMTDAEIESELKPGLCELGDILAFLKNPPEGTKDGYYNLFYLPSCVVGVGWDGFDGGWRVVTWDRDDVDWYRDERIFSPATDSSVSHSSTLESSDPSALPEIATQLKRIADALEKKGGGRKKSMRVVGERKA